MTTAQHLRLGIISRISNDPGRTVYHRCIVGWTMVKRSSSAENVSLRGPQYRRLALRQLAFEMGIDTCIYRVFFLTRPTIFFPLARFILAIKDPRSICVHQFVEDDSFSKGILARWWFFSKWKKPFVIISRIVGDDIVFFVYAVNDWKLFVDRVMIIFTFTFLSPRR